MHCSIIVRCAVHCLHRKRKCSTVSLACSHAHSSVAAALILWRYTFSLAMPVLSWASTLASFRDSWLYSRRVCLPGSAASTNCRAGRVRDRAVVWWVGGGLCGEIGESAGAQWGIGW